MVVLTGGGGGGRERERERGGGGKEEKREREGERERQIFSTVSLKISQLHTSMKVMGEECNLSRNAISLSSPLPSNT
jgi:hypothetical protein